MRTARILLVCLPLILLFFAAHIPAQAQPRERCFQETGFCVRDPILAYWEQNGGLPVFGYPITELRTETVEAIWTGPVQWFERDRLEDHTTDGQGVLAGRLGATLLELQGRPWTGFPQVDSAPQGCRYFAETKHAVCPPFAAYWEQNGGLERFGYPITEAQEERIGDWTGNVQYFERRRMEHHTENRGTQFEVLLGLLGKDVLNFGASDAPSTAGRIAFTSTRSGNQDIWVMNADGTRLTNLTNNPGQGDFQPAWSADGSRIAYVVGTQVTPDQDIWIMDANGANKTQLTNNPSPDWSPTLSPDGQRVAFVSDRAGDADIFIKNTDGSGEEVNLTTYAPDTAQYAPAWSPDGTRIAYVSNENEGGFPKIWVMSIDGINRYQLTTGSGERHNNPTWSPDNARIAFEYEYGATSQYLSIGFINTDATDRNTIYSASGSNPSWSPDGRSIAYESDGDIYVTNVTGGASKNMTNNAEATDRDAAWAR